MTRVVALIALLAMSVPGCSKIQSVFGRSSLPDMGPPVSMSIVVEFDPSLSNARLQYTNACNSPQELRVGEELESTLLQAAHQTFTTVYTAGKVPEGAKADMQVLLALQQSGLQIQTDGIYDRLPAELTLEVAALYRDQNGKVLLEQPLRVVRKEKLILEPTQHRCEYVTTGTIMHDAAVTLATQFIRHARALVAPDTLAALPPGQPDVRPTPAPLPPAVPAGTPPAGSAAAALSFKVTLLDGNNDHVLEGGEPITLRVDLVNSGAGAAQNVAVTLAGPPAVVSLFPATTLPVGTLQPAAARSVEFAATVPASIPAQRAEFHVSVSSSSAASPPAQTLVASVRPGGPAVAAGAVTATPYDDVDQVPTGVEGFQQPQVHVLAVGISTYRDQQIAGRKYAAQDAELLASYLQQAGGVPPANIRVLQDRKALRPDIEEALLDWLAPRVAPDSTVIMYFSGHAAVGPAGDTYLIPYEGNTLSTTRLYPVKDLEAALGTLKSRHVLFVFDGTIAPLSKDSKGKKKGPRWEGSGRNVVRLIGAAGLQSGLEPDRLRHGLFTYYVLRGLKGEADGNQDGSVSLGELTAFVTKAVPLAAKNQFRQDQRPAVIPPVSSSSQTAALTLTKLTGVAAR